MRVTSKPLTDYIRRIEPINRGELQDSLRGGDVPSVRHPQPYRFEQDEAERALLDDDYSKSPTVAIVFGWCLIWASAIVACWALFAVGRWLMR